MLGFSDLFSLHNSQVFVQFYEASSGRDLISREGPAREYQVDNIKIVEKYYKFGLDQRKNDMSVFSIILKQKTCTSQLNILDLSGCDHEELDLFAENCISSYTDPNASISDPIFKSILSSSALFIIARASYLDSVSQLEHTLSYISNIHEKTSFGRDRRSTSISANTLKNKTTQNHDTEYLRRIILKLSNEIQSIRHSTLLYQRGRGSLNTALSSSISSETDHGPRHASMFSSVSNSTTLTIPDPILEEKEHMLISDLNRQIEELENQIAVTRERNSHVERELQDMRSTSTQEQLIEIQEKQSCVIDGLEWKLNEMEQLNQDLHKKLVLETEIKHQFVVDLQEIKLDMNHLGKDRAQLNQLVNVIESMTSKGDRDNFSALQDLICFKAQAEKRNLDMMRKDEEIELLKYQMHKSEDTIQQLRGLKTIKNDESSIHSSDILFNQRTLALESRVEELDEYIEHIRTQRDHYSDQLDERIGEADKMQRAFVMQTSKVSSLETKLAELEEELNSNRKIIRDSDASGLVQRLEEDVARLQQERLIDEKDFESSYENALNEIELMAQRMRLQGQDVQRLESTVDHLNQQLDQTTNNYIHKEEELNDLQDQFDQVQKLNLEIKHKLQRVVSDRRQQHTLTERKDSLDSYRSGTSTASKRKQTQEQRNISSAIERKRRSLLSDYQTTDTKELLKWAQETSSDPQALIRKISSLGDENVQLASWISELETQLITHTLDSKTLEYEVSSLVMVNNQLERNLDLLTRQSQNKSITMSRSKSSSRLDVSAPLEDIITPLPTRTSNSSRRLQASPNPSLVSYQPKQQTKKMYTNNNNSRELLDNRVLAGPSTDSDAQGSRWPGARARSLSITSTHLPPAMDPPKDSLPPIPVLPYIPPSNSTTPVPATHKHISINSVLLSNDRDSRLSNSTITSNSSLPMNVEHYDHLLRNHKLRISVAENDIKTHQSVILKLESQLAASEAKIQEQRQEIECLLDEQETLTTVKNEVATTAKELKTERLLKQKAEHAHHILERRMEELMNTKKNKFLCF
ncbi:hypothetical protein INT48_006813 [Thamnidium elegans]|uniref:Kinesin motor domain-containing protein n=1 Tax=Thamnidium elegans TaxID=101142 RepID=A0A8H7SM34_9FUNG|nr:hypothetical protein INT48_006813 [Thamnidium elegans]